MLSFAGFDVRRLQRQAGKTIQQLTTEDGTVWRAPSGRDVDAANAARVAGALSDLRAEEFVAAPPAAVSRRRGWRSTFSRPAKRTPPATSSLLWPLNDGGCVARLSGDGDATFKPERSACDALRLDLLKKAD